MLLKLEGFKYANSLDLNMIHYHVCISKEESNLCTIILPWGNFQYKRLPMGVSNSPDIFRIKWAKYSEDLNEIQAYVDDLLIITSGYWSNHLENL